MTMKFQCWAIIALGTRQGWAKQYYEIENFLVKSKNFRTYGCACNVLHEFIFFIISFASFSFFRYTSNHSGVKIISKCTHGASPGPFSQPCIYVIFIMIFVSTVFLAATFATNAAFSLFVIIMYTSYTCSIHFPSVCDKKRRKKNEWTKKKGQPSRLFDVGFMISYKLFYEQWAETETN